MRTITYAKALNEALDESLGENEDVIIYGCDVGRWGGIFKITGGLQTKYGADRVFDSPISENVLVGAGVGAAVMGLRPVVELQFADFLITAGDEVFFKAGMWRFMHGGAFKVPMVLRLPLAVMAAYFLSALLSPDAIVHILGGDTGIAGILAASALGAVLPGGPYVSFPLALIVWQHGAGGPQLVAFLTSWAVLAPHRILIYEIPILGPRFVAIRIASSWMLPPLAGLMAMPFLS